MGPHRPLPFRNNFFDLAIIKHFSGTFPPMFLKNIYIHTINSGETEGMVGPPCGHPGDLGFSSA